MSGIRIWDQVIGVFPPYLSLTLIHPDGRGHTHWTDLEFLEEVQSRNWCESREGYADSNTGSQRIRLHWLPLGKPPGEMTIDHLDRNIFNSCRDNLRIVSKRGNGHNQKNHDQWGPGIHYLKARNKWILNLQIGESRVYRPAFHHPQKAQACRDLYLEIATAYDRKERDLPTREELVNIANQIKKGIYTS